MSRFNRFVTALFDYLTCYCAFAVYSSTLFCLAVKSGRASDAIMLLLSAFLFTLTANMCVKEVELKVRIGEINKIYFSYGLVFLMVVSFAILITTEKSNWALASFYVSMLTLCVSLSAMVNGIANAIIRVKHNLNSRGEQNAD